MKPLIASLALLLGLAGCAHHAKVRADPALAESPARAAEELGAQRVPEAALYLSYSRDELERARQLANQGEEEKAELMTRRAQADAEIALAITKKALADREASTATEEALKALPDSNQ
jgi:hypothetical protein